MKTFEKMAAQGDLLVQRIEKLPEDLVPFAAENNNYVVGHSETGHHHVIPTGHSQVYQNPQNLFLLFVVVDEDTTLKHLRSFDKHESLELKKGTYQINQQREHTFEGFRRAAD